MKLAIRADASVEMGSGHIMRCLALAGTVARGGGEVVFLTRRSTGALISTIESFGHLTHHLDDAFGTAGNGGTRAIDWRQDAERSLTCLARFGKPDWLVVDHYALDAQWEAAMRICGTKVFTIDDLANRPHDCDLLLDQNYIDGMEIRYQGLVAEKCTQLLGPRYALLRPEYALQRQSLRQRDGKVHRILVCFGGSDPSDETSKALRALLELNVDEIDIDVTVGALNKRLEEIRKLSTALLRAVVHVQADNMAALMASADLAIGAGGTTLWERCCLGLPSITVTTADNQEPAATRLAAELAVLHLGRAAAVTHHDLSAAINTVLRVPSLARSIGKQSLAITDGRGAERVREAMGLGGVIVRVRPATEQDCRRLFEWRNDRQSRYNSFNHAKIDWEDHQQWFRHALNAFEHVILIGESDGHTIGVVRYLIIGDRGYVSVILDPAFRGSSLGKRLLRAGECWLQLNRPEVATLIAEMVPQNTASHQAFAKAGFVMHKAVYQRALKEVIKA